MSEFTKTQIVDGSTGEDINMAIGYLSGTGGVVIVEEGTYIIDGANDRIEIPSNVTIIGRGNVILKVIQNYNVFRNSKYNDPDGNSRIVISGFKILIDRPSAAYNSDVILLQNVSNSIVEKVYVSVDENATQGMSGGRAAIAIRGNKDGDTVYPSVDNVVSQCTVKNLGYRNPNEHGPDTLSHYGYGIFLGPPPGVSDAANIYCKGTKINNNYISESKVGIQLVSAANNTISGNILINAQKGILTYDPDDWDDYDDYFRECIQGRDGINATICEYNTIAGNQINNNAEHGVYLSGSKRCTVMGNVCTYNFGAGIKTRYADPDQNIIEDEYHTIVGNVCHNNGYLNDEGGNGIHIQDYSNHFTIYGNSVCNNPSCGIRIHGTGADYNLMVGNVCDGNTDADISVVSQGSIRADNMADTCYPEL